MTVSLTLRMGMMTATAFLTPRTTMMIMTAFLTLRTLRVGRRVQRTLGELKLKFRETSISFTVAWSGSTGLKLWFAVKALNSKLSLEQFLNNFCSPGGPRTYSFGFGYGCTWGSIILIFASVVLLICDRESEEIFYKERQVEEEEEEETGEA